MDLPSWKPDQQQIAIRKKATDSNALYASVIIEEVNVNAISIVLAGYIGKRRQSLFCLSK